MNLIEAAVASVSGRRRSFPALAFDDWVSMFTYGNYPAMLNQTLVGNREDIPSSFSGLALGAYQGNGIVFALELRRMLLFSQARFQWQQMRGGRPGDLFGTPDLAILERPEPGKVTSDLLLRMLNDADIAGTAFLVRRPNRIKRLRPDWVGMMLGSMDRNPNLDPNDVDTEFVGVAYQPGGPGSGRPVETYTRDEVAVFSPIPDPLAHYRGMSWLTPIIREISTDTGMTLHKSRFLEHGATPNMKVTIPATVTNPTLFNEWVDAFEQNHAGVTNAFRTMYMGMGADATVIGTNLQELDYRAVQGAGETRLAAAALVPPVVAGLSEGLQGASLNTGNYGSAKRSFADMFARPYWGNAAASLEAIVPAPPGARLWFDDRDIPYLAEDIKDRADALFVQSQSIRQLTDGGFEPDSAVDAIVAGDLRRLVHSGLPSVQVQQPGPNQPQPTPQLPVPATNGRSDDGWQMVAMRALEMSARPAPEIHNHMTAPEVNVTVPPTVIERGAISAPITVNSPDIHVTTPDVNVTTAPVNVTTPPVTIERGAFELSAPVNVTTPDIHIAPAAVNVTTPDIHVTTPPVNVTSPEINVTTPEVRVEVPPTVIAEGAVQVNLPEQRSTRKTVKRDAAGRITEVLEE